MDMKTPLSSMALLAACLLFGCGPNKADRYTPPPNDGSAPANSEDVVDNPSIQTGGPAKWDKKAPSGQGGSGGSGSAGSTGPDVVDAPSITAAKPGEADTVQGMDVVDRPSEVAKATAMKGFKYIDPISGEPITGEGHIGYYGMWQVRFQNGDNAKQFASLPKAKRAKVATVQVLAQKGITNTTCPMTGATLDAAAAPVKYDGKIIGFATVADANQFRSLNKEKQAQMIEKWKQSPNP